MTDSQHDDADDLLQWLNAHSVSVSDGIPFSLMQQKWTATRRELPQLRSSLEWLFGQDLVAMTPGLEQPHIRLSPKGFQKLLTATDSARHVPVAAPVPAPTPVATTAFKPALLPAATPLLPNEPVATTSSAPKVEEVSPQTQLSRFVDPSKQPTEIGLRNQILLIFRDLKLQAGQQLIAMTLTRYWQEMGQRGEHLRAGIDIMLRDNYLQPAVKRYENYWTLMPDGHAYLTGALPPATLLALAQPLREIGQSLPDEDLRRKGLGLFKKSNIQSFVTLETSWRHSRDSLIHALDLLCKSGDLQLDASGPLAFALTNRGMAHKR